MPRKRDMPDADALVRRKTAGAIRFRYSDALRRWTESQFGVRLPDSSTATATGGCVSTTAAAVPMANQW
jgi:hypothetical protein